MVISFGCFIVFFMSQTGLRCVCERKFCSVTETQLDARLLCQGATDSLFSPQLLFLFADSRGLKDTARRQESFPPVKVITKRSCSHCHRAQGARTARRTGFATSPTAFPAQHKQCPSPKKEGPLALTTGLGAGDRFKNCHLLLSFP